MSTFINTGNWVKGVKSYKHWLNLDLFVKNIILQSISLINTNFIPVGKLTIYKHPLNNLSVNENILQINDVAIGFLPNGTFIPVGKYLGGAIQNIDNWDTSPMWLPQ